jgi:hypothetical protein
MFMRFLAVPCGSRDIGIIGNCINKDAVPEVFSLRGTAYAGTAYI